MKFFYITLNKLNFYFLFILLLSPIYTFSQNCIADAGLDQTICNTSTTTLTGNDPGSGTGVWEFVSAANGAIITDPTVFNTTVTNIAVGTLSLKWTVSGSCTPTSDEIVVERLSDLATSDLISDSVICQGGTMVFDTNASGSATPYNYQWQTSTDGINNWTDISGQTNSSYTTDGTLNVGNYFYRVVVRNSCTQITSNVAKLTIVGDPIITSQPAAISICAGSSGHFFVGATGGTPNLTYQWYSSTDNTYFNLIPGATSSSYDTPSIPANTIIYYRVEVSAAGNGCGTVTSMNAFAATTVQSSNPITITTQPKGVTICENYTYLMKVVATTSDPAAGALQYQWQSSTTGTSDWTNVTTGSGGNTADYTTEMLRSTTHYRVRVTQATGTCETYSNTTLVYVARISTQPVAREEVCSGETANLTISATLDGGEGTLSYRWQSSTDNVNWVSVVGGTGATTDSYTSGVLTAPIFYRCIVNSSVTGCGIVSTSTEVAITPPPVITAEPDLQNPTICVGGSAHFLVSATGGTSGLGYQWYSSPDNSPGSFILIPGATSSTYDTPPFATAATYYYHVEVSDIGNGCLITSRPASATVISDPVVTTQPVGTTICPGETHVLSAAVNTSVLPPIYQWQSSVDGITGWTDVVGGTGATTNTYTTAALPSTLYYRLRITQEANGCETYTDIVPVFIVAILEQPTDPATVYAGNTVNLSITGGQGSLSYQWQSDTGTGFVNETNATATTTNFVSDTLSITTKFRCLVGSSITSCSVISNEVTATVISDPIIITQPHGGFVCVGGILHLSVEATGGTPDLNYQWYSSPDSVGFTPIPGAIFPDYTPPPLTKTTHYQVEVSNTVGGLTTSNNVTALVIPDPVINTQPVGSAICLGETYTMSVAASGQLLVLSYQWQSSLDGTTGWTDVSGGTGATTNTYTTAAATSSLYYRVKITQNGGDNCETDSNVALVSIAAITAQPQTPAVVCEGGTVNLSISASLNGGEGTLSYQWQSDSGTGFVDETNTTATTENFVSDELLKATKFRCLVTLSATCILTSDEVTAAIVPDPTITDQPIGTIICFGGNHTMSVLVTNGLPDLAYQWYNSIDNSNFALIPEATSMSYTTPNLAETTYYRVEVSSSGNGCTTTTSSTAIVKVLSDIIISTQPVAKTNICDGSTSTLSVAVRGGSGDYVYQWKNATALAGPFTDIAGANSATYTTPVLSQNSYYQVAISDVIQGCKSVTSNVASILTLDIVTQPVDPGTVCVGGTASVSTLASANDGPATFAYQWQSSPDGTTAWVNVSGGTGATTPNYTSGAMTTTTYYRCIITSSNPTCVLTTNTAKATVIPDPTIVTQPVGGSICEGGVFMLSSDGATGGSGNYTYQWQKSIDGLTGWTNILGANTTTYTTVALFSDTFYRLKVTDSGAGCGIIYTNPAKVAVFESPIISLQPKDGEVCINTTHTFTVTATANIPSSTLLYQWQVASVLNGPYANVVDGTGGTTATYTTPVYTTADKKYFRVVISQLESGCETTSNQVTLDIFDIPLAPIGDVIEQPSCDSQYGTIAITNPDLGTGYEYSIDGITFQASNIFSGLTPGIKQVFVRRKGLGTCISNPASFTIFNRICAVAETFTPISGDIGGSTGTQTILDSDTLNGVIVNPSDVVVTTDFTSAFLTFNASDNTITVAAGTPAGDYTLDYVICEKTNPSNCSTTTETIEVTTAGIDAQVDVVDHVVNGHLGESNVINVLTNDQLASAPATISNVKIAIVNPAQPVDPGTSVSVPVLDSATGQVDVPAGTVKGLYEIRYQICQTPALTPCDQANVLIQVGASVIVANDDMAKNINGFIGEVNVINAFENDSLDGVPITTANLDAIIVTQNSPATPTYAGANVPVFSTATGEVTVPAETPADTYYITYTICEKLNPSNCSSASISVVVDPAPIVVNDDVVNNVDGYTGAVNAINAYTNTAGADTFNGEVINISLTDVLTPKILIPATSIGGGPVPVLVLTSGRVNIPSGTPAGAYQIKYQVCENLNPTNCDDAIIDITVVAPVIAANDDAVGNIIGYSGANDVINAYDNDVLDGGTLDLSQITTTIISSPSPINGGAIPVLDTATGFVSVPAGTPAGEYKFVYKICEELNPTNCDDATITITVIAAPIVAVDDAPVAIFDGGINTANAINVLGNDLLNNVAVIPAEVQIDVLSPATPIGGGLVPVLSPSTGIVSIPAGTATGTYTITYRLSEKLNLSNNDTAVVTIKVKATILAVNDTTANINGYVGQANAINAIANDLLNGVAVQITQVNITSLGLTTPADYVSGNPVPVLDTATGQVSVPAGTSAGVYTIHYSICEKLAATNCSEADIVVNIVEAQILANNDSVNNINGHVGQVNAINAITNDRLNGVNIQLSKINITSISTTTPIDYVPGNRVPVLNITTGNVNIPAETSAGVYTIHYGICEKLNPTNCSEADIAITVIAANINAVDDFVDNINGYTGGNNVVNALTNDELNNVSVQLQDVTIRSLSTTVPSTSTNGIVPVLDSLTGFVDVPAGTSAGTYIIDYEICEKLNPTNCNSAKIVIVVAAAPIVAEDDTVNNVNGYTGANNVLNAFANDTYNDILLTDVSLIIPSIVTPASPINGGSVPTFDTATGLVSIPAGTSAGSYQIRYKICEKLNPSNCDDATITITVIAAPIVAVDDAPVAIFDGGINTANAVNVLANDTLNGAAVVAAEVQIDVLSPATPIGGGLVPVLSPSTGIVSIPAGTATGTYTITYRLSEKLNLSNNDTAVVTIKVKATILAVNDTTANINGYVGQANAINAIANDLLNGVAVQITQVNITSLGLTTPADYVSGNPVPVLDTATGQVSVPAGTSAGAYMIHYSICEKLAATNCSEADIVVNVVEAQILANNDSVSNVDGYVGATTVVNAIANDLLNGVAVQLPQINITSLGLTTPADYVSGNPVPVLDTATGEVSVPAGTSVGVYTIHYGICEKLNPTNCSEADISIAVTTANINAADDFVSNINGYTGANNVVNAYDNDTLNGVALDLSQITTTIVSSPSAINGGAIPVLDTATGFVSVPAGTSAGEYKFVYKICENLNPTNCDDATITITVIAPVIVANDDAAGNIIGASGANNVINAYDNDTLNGVALNLSQITTTIISSPSAINGGAIPVLDTATGFVSVPAGTPAGEYKFVYKICENLNPSNCDDATITITVIAAAIVAVDDAPVAIFDGGINTANAVNVLANDTLNGAAVVAAEVQIDVLSPATPIGGGLVPVLSPSTGIVSIPAGTATGTYTITYRLSEKLNLSNNDTAVVTIKVKATILAVNDTTANINGYVGQANAINAIANDLLNGVAVQITQVNITSLGLTTPADYVSGNPVPVLDTATGQVSVPAGTSAGAYMIHYSICEKLAATNCSEADIVVNVVEAQILANNDSVSNVDGYVGATTVVNAIANDLLNGVAVQLPQINITSLGLTTPADYVSGNPVPVLDTATGEVSVPAGTSVGVYTIHYGICEKLNPTNCSEADISIAVTTANINAADDFVSNINGYTGANNVVNAYDNDTLNGVALDLSQITTTIVSSPSAINGGAIPVLDTATGFVSVPAGTSAGEYKFVYKICENLNPTNCDDATITITVIAPVIVANDDAAGNIIGASGANNVINAYDNDTLNGVALNLSQITTTIISSPSAINGGAIPVLDTATGFVSVPAGTPAGEYKFVYKICENLNPTNCDDATITITVIAAAIVAVDDAPVAIFDGGINTANAVNVLANDTLNGAAVVAAEVQIDVLSPATPIGGGLVPVLSPSTGIVSIPAGTATGTYTITYRLSEKLNLSNNDTAVVTIKVKATILAVNDTTANINGYVGQANAINAIANDLLNGVAVQITQVNITSLGLTTPADYVSGNPVPVLDTATGQVSVPAGTSAGVYTIHYSICEKLAATNCSEADIVVNVVEAQILANNDSASNVDGYVGATTVVNAIANDLLNGVAVQLPQINITSLGLTTPADYVSGNPVPVLDTATGEVSVPAGTSVGVYTIHYGICEKLNPTNCSEADIAITVIAANINAADDFVSNINGYTGANNVVNAYDNDTLNGVALNLSQITTTIISSPSAINGGAIPVLDTATGFVSVPAGTSAGEYKFVYKICENLNPSNCDDATITITVIAPVIAANDDAAGNIIGASGANNVVNAYDNDTLNGVALNLSAITTTIVSSPSAINGGAIPVLDTATGFVSVPAGTSAGEYKFVYKICENLNPSNCDDATITITVIAPVIVANDDAAGNIIGASGANNVVNAYDNDTLNGVALNLSQITTTIVSSPSAINGGAIPVLDTATGFVSVPAGTSAGEYKFVYKICENLNPTNCDDATITITVIAAPIVAVDDAPVAIFDGGINTANAVNVLANDILNGTAVVAAEVQIDVLSPATPIGGGLVPVLSPSTGIVSIPAGTATGTYTITYRLSEKLNLSNNDTAVVTIKVKATILAVNDTTTDINGYVGQANAINAIANDLLNGVAVQITQVNITSLGLTTPADYVSGNPVPVLDTATGQVSVPAGTSAGAYMIHYSICEKLAATNCSEADIVVNVVEAQILANNDSVSNVDGYVGATTVVNAIANDLLNGVAVQLPQINITSLGLTTPADYVSGNPVPVLDTATGEVSVPAGTSVGVYTIHYGICEKLNPTNCSEADISIAVTTANINAADDFVDNINGYTGANDVVNAYDNDTLNGVALNLSAITTTIVSSPSAINGGAIPVLDTATGFVSVPAGTSAGEYKFVYKICENLNPSNCDDATITITVIAPVIVANDDAVGNIIGYSGANDVINAYDNDVLDGGTLDLSQITTTIVSSPSAINGGAIPVLDTATGFVSVPAGTSAGEYKFVYKICENLNPTNCDDATITITVIAPVIVANDDAAGNIIGASGANNVINAYDNDTLNGVALNLSAITTTIVSSPSAINGGAIPVLDTATGFVNVPAGTSAGEYKFVYKICENLNPSNCDDATITITVIAAAIVAVDDAPVAIFDGGINTANAINVLANDILNGTAVVAAEVQIDVLSPATPIGGGLVPVLSPSTGIVSIPAGTATGTYTITYRLSEKLNLSNNDTAVVTIKVKATILAVNDTTANINGYVGQANAINAIANDLLNGVAVQITQVNITSLGLTTPADYVSGNPVPVLDTATGQVSVPAGTSAGVYTIHYSICEKLAATNCSEADIVVNVVEAQILANNDSVSNVDGYVGATAVVNAIANDRLNGVDIQLSEINITSISTITPADYVSGNPVPVLDTATGEVSVPAGTSVGVYTIHYGICEKLNPTNCSEADIAITVIAANINAADDFVSNINGYTGANNVVNAYDNDTLNGVALNLSQITTTIISSPSAINGGAIPVLDTATGFVSVPAGTSAGEYKFVYKICENLNPTNCDDATITITVIAPVIVANDDAVGNIIGASGANNVVNAYDNDTLNGVALNLSAITTTIISSPSAINGGAIPVLDTATGFVSVPAGTSAGEYKFVYKICENLNPSNCDDATITITVIAPVIAANDDAAGNIIGASGANNVVNAYDNDTLNGVALNLSQITTTIVSSPSAINGGAIPVLDTATGFVSVPAGTSAGEYKFVYKICENLNPTNCDDATITITVIAAPIVAVDDAPVAIFDGGINTANAVNVLANDTLNGAAVVAAEVQIDVLSPATPIGGGLVPVLSPSTGIVSIPAGTATGTYTITYRLSEKLNLSNNDTAVVTIKVKATILAVNDTTANINGYVGQANAINAIANDLLNGVAVQITQVNITSLGLTTPADYVSGNPVPVLDTATGQVSVPAGTSAGAYMIHYSICEKLAATNCSEADIVVNVVEAQILANNDSVSNVDGYVGATTVVNAIANDLLNGVAVQLPQINITSLGLTTPADYVSGNPVPVLDTATGEVSVPAGTSVGVYTIHYGICEKLNPTNCSEADISIAVTTANINAADDFVSNINGYTGANDVVNALANDELNNMSVQLQDVTIRSLNTTVPSTSINGIVPVLNTLTGFVDVPAGTSLGTYIIDYEICEKSNLTSCNSAKIVVIIDAAPIVAEDDTINNVNGYTGANNVLNAFANDTYNGVPLTDVSLITPSIVTPASPINGGAVPMFDTATGLVSIPVGTPAGAYQIKYKICENLNPTNCNEAVINIMVIAPVVVANDDVVNNVVGYTGANNVANAYDNDTLNGAALNLSAITATIVSSPSPINGGTIPVLDTATGFVSVPAGTPAGEYKFVYKICENLNAGNCDDAIIIITVVAVSIDAVDDAPPTIFDGAVDTANAVNVLANDILNGAAVVAAEVQIDVLSPATPIGGGLVPVLSPSTGIVSIPAGTATGTYTITYRLSEKLNLSNNDTAVVTIKVGATILAVNDTTTDINGYVGQANAINAIANDLLNGVAVQLPQINITSLGLTTPADYVSGNPVPVLDTATGQVNVPAGTSAGVYTIHYSICEKLAATNCSEADIVVNVIEARITANTDSAEDVNGYVGATNVLNVLDNDTFNDSSIDHKPAKVRSIDHSQITITILSPASPINGNPNIPVLNTATGVVSVPARTPAGLYQIQYRIAENLNLSSFDDAVVYITVTAATIEANDDTVLNINGFKGQTDVINVVPNDNLNGVAVPLAEITIGLVTPATPIDAGPVPTLDLATGSVSVPAGTPSGTYTIRYSICENLNATNCSEANSIITVISGPIIANDDAAGGINGLDGANDVLNVLPNDLLDNKAPTLSQVTISVVSPADIISSSAVPFLDPATGNVSVPTGTSSGIYTISYHICENLNPDNCDEGVIKITVLQPSIELIKRGVFSDSNGDGYAQAGELIRYSFFLINTGTMDLNNVILTDPKATIVGDPIATLAVGESNTTNYTGTYVLTQEDINLGTVENQALVIAQPTRGSAIQDLSDSDDPTLLGKDDPTITRVNQLKELTLIKSGELIDTGRAGSVINYDFVVKNTGSVVLTNIEIADPLLATTSLVVTPNILTPGQIGRATASYTVTAADAENGEVMNTAVVVGDAPDGTQVDDVSDSNDPTLTDDDDPTVVDLKVVPSIALVKIARFNDENKNGYAEIGETVTYHFSITNTGNVVLVNVVVKDPKPGLTITGGPISLNQTETNTTEFVGTYTLTAQDIKEGSVTNQATVEAVSTGGLEATDESDDSSNFENDPTILSLTSCQVTIYNAISPNGDGKNDTFIIDGIECYPNAFVEIYDRWGALVYDSYGYDNKTIVFAGISEGKSTVNKNEELPPGTYFYLITYKTYLGEDVHSTGYLYLSR